MRIAIAVLTGVALAIPATAQTRNVISGIARVRVRQELGRPPATAFVVAVKNGTAWLVTSAHVVAGDQTPTIEFEAAPTVPYQATIRAFEGADERGLALLIVTNVPSVIKALPGFTKTIERGTLVTVDGYPASVPALAQLNTSVVALSSRDLLLKDETEEGYSGGPVLMNDAVIGVVYGHEGRRGKALGASSIVPFLKGNDIEWVTETSTPGPRKSKIINLATCVGAVAGSLWAWSEKVRFDEHYQQYIVATDLAQATIEREAAESAQHKNWLALGTASASGVLCVFKMRHEPPLSLVFGSSDSGGARTRPPAVRPNADSMRRRGLMVMFDFTF